MTMAATAKKPFERLPTLITPVNYQISLIPYVEKRNFDGFESIELKINKTTDKIVLNSNKIEILTNDPRSNVRINDKTIKIKEINYNTDDETASIVLSEPLQSGTVGAKLNLAFKGLLGDKLNGFYPSNYTGPDGVERRTAVTQFEATDARLAFPCWDEPAHKATFDITLVVPDDGKTLALSNMPVKNEEIDSEKRRVVHFDRTPIMSTYLVAFVVGEFDFIETRSKHGILVRVYTPIGKKEQGRFALDVAARSLDFYTDYFNIPYPLSKLDLIAVSDFAAGAMENWGLVTYRETCLLVDPANTATIRKQNVTLTVAHELAHQWFGNLVTMEWWTHLWLNEGFATFMQYLCTDHLFPEFNIWTQFVSDVLLSAMDLDSLDNSHPIEVPVGHPSEVDQIFDEISYSKGASVIRMLYHYIGDGVFRKGMKSYLERHSFKNALTEDLWDSLENASNKPIRRMMTTWTKQKGYPVISVKMQKSENKINLLLNQEKFNATGKLSENDSKMLWANPIQVITASFKDKPIAEILLEKRSDLLPLKEFDTNEWLKLNPSAVGTYRVNYDQTLLQNLRNGVQKQSLSAVDRLNLIDDLYAMTLAGKNSSDELLKAIESFNQEYDYTVWTVMSNVLGKYNQLLYGMDCYQKFVSFGTKLIVTRAYPEIGWDPKPQEPHLNTLLRSLLINRLVVFEHEEIMKKCQKAFEDHVEKRQLIPADLRSAVYQAMARKCDNDNIWEQFMKLYNEASLQEEKNRIASSLGAVKKPEYIQRVLKFAISPDVRSQDTVFVVGAVSRNPLARQAAWDFFVENKDLFKKRYENGFLGNHLVKTLTGNFHTKEMAEKIEDFFNKNRFEGWDRSIQQSIETIKLNVQLMERDQEKLAKYFQ